MTHYIYGCKENQIDYFANYSKLRKMKFTDQSKNAIIDKLSGLFGKIYIKEKQIRKVITNEKKILKNSTK